MGLQLDEEAFFSSLRMSLSPLAVETMTDKDRESQRIRLQLAVRR